MKRSKEEYVHWCTDLAISYIEGVLNGSIITNKWIKKQVEYFVNWKHDDRYDFREDLVDKVYKYYSYININKNDKFVQWPMMSWQAFFLAGVYGFYHKGTDIRKHQEALLYIARKNTKTTTAASLGPYGLLKDDVADPQCLLLAKTKLQARNALSYTKSIIYHSDPLFARLRVNRGQILPKDIRNQGWLEILSTKDPLSIEGTSPSFVLFDEIHSFDSKKAEEVYSAVQQGTGARRNPLRILATTGGTDVNEFMQNHIEVYKNILEGKIEDETKFGLIYQAEDGDDLGSEETWLKANPSLYDLPTLLPDIRKNYLQVKNSVSERAKRNFMSRRLNIFTEEAEVWIPREKLVECVNKNLKLVDFEGQECWLGLDLAATSDLASLSIVFGDEEHITVFVKYFMGNNPDKLMRKGNFDLTPYINSGLIHRSNSNTIDFDAIKRTIFDIAENYYIQKLVYDKFNAPVLISGIQKESDLVFCEHFPQNFSNFNLPMKHIERLIENKSIEFEDNEVLLWNFANVVILEDDLENIRPSKLRSKDSIDGLVATAMAIGSLLETLNPVYKINHKGEPSFI